MLRFPVWKTAIILLTMLFGALYTSPNLVPENVRRAMPNWLADSTINLGLDLRGGSYLLLEIEPGELEHNKLTVLSRDVQQALLKKPVVKFTQRRVAVDGVRFNVVDESQIDEAVKRLKDLSSPVGGVGGPQSLKVTVENKSVLVAFSDAQKENLQVEAIQDSIETVRRRVDAFGTTDPSISRQGSNRIVLEVPGLDDPQSLIELVQKAGVMTVNLVDDEADPSQYQLDKPRLSKVKRADAYDPNRTYVLNEDPIVTGADFGSASQGFDEQGRPQINFTLTGRGPKAFGDFTSANVGRSFAIVLDGKVISAANVRTPILSGSGRITGSFTMEEANNIAIVLRSGELAAPLNVVEQRVVGPGMGQESITAGAEASLLGLALVAIFMIFVYRLWGVFAVISLAANIMLIMGALSLLGATLTLPGIAGIVLTIGMAVDANVLVFERIREEARNGRSPMTATEFGYKEASSSIFDANITTLIAAAVLFNLGSGPVKGFAVTLGIGVVTSVFTAFVFTRLLMSTWLKRAKPKSLVPDKEHKGFKFEFMKLRMPAFALSGALILASIALVPMRGLNFGIDFAGGIVIEIETQEPIEIPAIRSALAPLDLGDVQVVEVQDPVLGIGQDSTVAMIRTETPAVADDSEAGATQAATEKILSALRAEFGDIEVRRNEAVGPKVSGELLQDGIVALVVALGFMLLYIWFRFEGAYSIGAVAALAHDLVLTIGMFALTQFEFNLSTIAALLTIVGYSMNDTVVVYDRVREELRKYKKMPLTKVIDLALNNTLSRTTLTSGTTMLALVSIFIFGGETLRGFSFAMIWGVFVGTYSSIFVASALLLYTNVRRTAPTTEDGGKPPKSDPETGAVV